MRNEKTRINREKMEDLLKDWQKHSTITEKDFFSLMEWLTEDPMDQNGKLTRAVGLTRTGGVKLHYVYTGSELRALYGEDRRLFTGSTFYFEPRNEHEALFAGSDGMIHQNQKIAVNLFDLNRMSNGRLPDWPEFPEER